MTVFVNIPADVQHVLLAGHVTIVTPLGPDALQMSARAGLAIDPPRIKAATRPARSFDLFIDTSHTSVVRRDNAPDDG